MPNSLTSNPTIGPPPCTWKHGGEKDSPVPDTVGQISQQDKNRQDPCDVDGEDEGQSARPEPEPEPVGIGGIKSGRQGG
jgi:hypothetical protein